MTPPDCSTTADAETISAFSFIQDGVIILKAGAKQYPCGQWLNQEDIERKILFYQPSERFWQMLKEAQNRAKGI
jgi:hypothetical protein